MAARTSLEDKPTVESKSVARVHDPDLARLHGFGLETLGRNSKWVSSDEAARRRRGELAGCC